MTDPRASATRADRGSRAAAVGLAVTLLLIALAVSVPLLTGWDVVTRAARSEDDRAVPPLHGVWVPHIGVATIAVVVLALLALRYAASLALTLPWRGVLAAGSGAAFTWMLSLALVDGPSGISRVLGNPWEYLRTAREVDDIGVLLSEYLSRVPLDAQDNWVTHVAGHPPGMLLVFVALVRMGLGADFVAGLIVTAIASLLAPAVLVTVRALVDESTARRAAPFVVFTPAAVFLSVSADAVIAVVGAWGIALLALGATSRRSGPLWAWSAGAGLLLGGSVMMSYGMPLYGVLAVAVLIAAKRWQPLPIAAGVALLVVLSFAAAGFALWEAFPVISERYWDGIARRRPFEYWVWGNLAALAISAGPFVGAGIAATGARWRELRRGMLLLVGAGIAMVVLADLSGMSKAEVERIWLPFMPWLTLAMAALPDRWLRPALGGQLLWAVLVQHLLYTVW
ncbi:hypothetical protein [Microbacterium awajiense]|uniref:hypothetical protein n=1 Tax=Microbacterium awajiense TaxID=415214 RepID=UPI0031DE2433